jgi:hypothetical protein
MPHIAPKRAALPIPSELPGLPARPASVVTTAAGVIFRMMLLPADIDVAGRIYCDPRRESEPRSGSDTIVAPSGAGSSRERAKIVRLVDHLGLSPGAAAKQHSQ